MWVLLFSLISGHAGQVIPFKLPPSDLGQPYLRARAELGRACELNLKTLRPLNDPDVQVNLIALIEILESNKFILLERVMDEFYPRSLTGEPAQLLSHHAEWPERIRRVIDDLAIVSHTEQLRRLSHLLDVITGA